MSSAVRESVSDVAEGAVPGSAPLRADEHADLGARADVVLGAGPRHELSLPELAAPALSAPVPVEGPGDPRPAADVLVG